MKVKSQSEVAQSCPTLSDPMDCSLPGSSVHGIFQARVLEWGAIAFSTNWLQELLIHSEYRPLEARWALTRSSPVVEAQGPGEVGVRGMFPASCLILATSHTGHGQACPLEHLPFEIQKST